MRLDKFFASQSLASRKEVKELVKKGLIKINGIPARSSDMTIIPDRDMISFNGKTISYKEHIYIMLNKPQGVVSSTEDNLHATVLDLIPPELFRKGLFPAGRLDKDTVGFVLITDDGDFAHRILSPKKHVPKTYEAIINNSISQEDIAAFREGVQLKDGTLCLHAELKILKPDVQPLVQIVIHEGKYHQIKRMFEARGKRVLFLKRIKIGNLSLDDNLAPGECREILHKELNQILE
ncbi:MAG: pseudouridine synthase [Clostridiales bacterium]|nr:pseudouridine synthase [Clostridiales bacterium]